MGYDENLANPTKRLEIIDRYRSVFLRTKNGRELLAHMLLELGLFETTDMTEREQGRHDYAIHLLGMLGINKPQNMLKFVNASRAWPAEYPKPEVDEHGEEVDSRSDKTPRSLTPKSGSEGRGEDSTG